MKVLSTSQIREADQYTILHEPIASIDLMERAATQLFEWFSTHLDPGYACHIVCGPGNNGGDGLVLARLLSRNRWQVRVSIVWYMPEGSPDFRTNLARLEALNQVQITAVHQGSDFVIQEDEVLVDALFGSGLSRPAEGISAGIIREMNQSGAMIIAVDMPSGLYADCLNDYRKDVIIRADSTLSFEVPRLSFFLEENQDYLGKWQILPIGLHPDILRAAETRHFLLSSSEMRPLLKTRKKFAHKGHFGHALLVAGNPGKLGAAVMAAEACLRAGVGLLTVSLPPEGIPVMQTALPEAMVFERPTAYQFLPLKTTPGFNSIAAGPGLGTDEPTANALKLLIQTYPHPLILDADALNILGENKTWLAFLPKGSILSPHPKEFERLVGKCADSMERMEKQRDMSQRFGIYIILKGAHSSISTPDGLIYFNSTGNPGMATGGSGDVLTGILLGLRAQGYTPLETALLGSWIHGFAADLALEESAWEALLPVDITAALGSAFRLLREG
jgi:NAD(P)H-hydrate epimerase